MRVALNPITGDLVKKEIWRQTRTHTHRARPCGNGDRDLSDASTRQGTPPTDGDQEGPCPRGCRGRMALPTPRSQVSSLQKWENKCLSFYATRSVVLCPDHPEKLVHSPAKALENTSRPRPRRCSGSYFNTWAPASASPRAGRTAAVTAVREPRPCWKLRTATRDRAVPPGTCEVRPPDQGAGLLRVRQITYRKRA